MPSDILKDAAACTIKLVSGEEVKIKNIDEIQLDFDILYIVYSCDYYDKDGAKTAWKAFEVKKKDIMYIKWDLDVDKNE